MKKKKSGIFLDGIINNNPVFVQFLGLCPTLAVTTSVQNGLGMGLSATFVLVCSNLFISLLRRFIPRQIRLPSYIVIIAGFVTLVEMLLNAFFYDTLASSLGVFVPLIVVNCIILSRAEVFASKNKPLPSVIDGLSVGIGFTAALLIISAVREIFGTGKIAGIDISGDFFSPAQIIAMPAGALLVLGLISALINYIVKKDKKV